MCHTVINNMGLKFTTLTIHFIIPMSYRRFPQPHTLKLLQNHGISQFSATLSLAVISVSLVQAQFQFKKYSNGCSNTCKNNCLSQLSAEISTISKIALQLCYTGHWRSRQMQAPSFQAPSFQSIENSVNTNQDWFAVSKPSLHPYLLHHYSIIYISFIADPTGERVSSSNLKPSPYRQQIAKYCLFLKHKDNKDFIYFQLVLKSGLRVAMLTGHFERKEEGVCCN
ncbi:hypothetical protein Anapl_10573 [Anas platyrhynchos]|uniref:Uncharacterized protein n=1 Tax=Anas platyrhynchos TaxID=8839 RepID=R0KG15_ANAPL|nr:hypothetical protein Anapl_10573 [Anas platyrhynchos]